MITLIIPPSPYLLDDKTFVSLGPLYVAAVLEQKKYEIRVLDLKGEKDWKSKVCKIAEQENLLIGVTATTPDFPIALETLKIIKSVNKDTPVVIGGAHATVAPQQCKMFNQVIVGDGVTGIFAALKSDQKLIHGEMVKNLDELPFPARHFINLKSYHYKLYGRNATNVISQFGCPFNCIFCCGRNIKEYRTVRYRSPKNFIKELDFLNKEYGYDAFMIHDDEFNLNKERTFKLCKALNKKEYAFRGFVRADLFTEELAKAMAKAGFCQVDVGVESGSAKILKIIRKNTTPEINSRARVIARKYGLKFKAFVTLGHPSETREDIAMTKQWLIDNKPDAFEIYMITPYPGSQIYDQKKNFDLEFSIDYTSNITSITRKYGEYRCYVRNSHLTSDELAHLREEIDKEVRMQLGLSPTKKIL